jgi:Transposase DDE domain
MNNIPNNTMLALQANNITDLYFVVDNLIEKIQDKRGGRPPLLSCTEVITILIWNVCTLKQKTLKDIYNAVKMYHGKDFPKFPSYNSWIEECHKAMPQMILILRQLFDTNQEVRIADSTMLPVCKIIRSKNHKVAKGIAAYGKNWQGWHYGFKMHLSVSLQGKPCAVHFTSANVHDLTVLEKLVNEKTKIVVGDTIYGGKKRGREIFEKFNCLVLSPPHPKQVKQIMTDWQFKLLRRRSKIECVFDYLKEHLHLVSSFPRSINGYFLHYLKTLLGYCFLVN